MHAMGAHAGQGGIQRSMLEWECQGMWGDMEMWSWKLVQHSAFASAEMRSCKESKTNEGQGSCLQKGQAIRKEPLPHCAGTASS
eukprot:207954-Pelagomonas_calceolata.AAC.2